MHPNDKLRWSAKTYPVGTPVIVGEQRSKVIASPQWRGETVHMLCANIGRWVPISELKKIEG